jgi:hypothetical protein
VSAAFVALDPPAEERRISLCSAEAVGTGHRHRRMTLRGIRARYGPMVVLPLRQNRLPGHRVDVQSVTMTTNDSRHQVDHGSPMPEPPRNAAQWDDWYAAGTQMFSGQPNPALLAEVSELQPGRALDIGCGEGADAVWLADRGWEVAALDVSPATSPAWLLDSRVSRRC